MTQHNPTSSSPESSCLHSAALTGNETSACCVLRAGANVNACNLKNQKVLMCAIAGNKCMYSSWHVANAISDWFYCSWQQADASNASGSHCGRLGILRMLLLDTNISLVTLNTPQSTYWGLTPLGMAAWLNQADVMRILLEESSKSVAVDATDAHGATLLMQTVKALFKCLEDCIGTGDEHGHR
ncbi:unnamed protein product [Mycena citricolor]|uniref:Ankyrin n=1 Tax=Mycena citricolor TaxID=2018698 RepID=A0AAD2K2V4_9AGAR|nr:unnamed protein product [Mycena citricolor]